MFVMASVAAKIAHRCQQLESAPFVPPASLLLVLARVVKGAEVVDLRPSAGVAHCLSSAAKAYTALSVGSLNASRCHALEDAVHPEEQISESHTFACRENYDFHKHGIPDADYIMWWQMLRFWTTPTVFSYLAHAGRHDRIRKTAHALLLFDMTQWRDAIDWQNVHMNATWHTQVAFDETELCLARHPTKAELCNTRANGSWIAATFPLSGYIDRLH